MSKRSRQWWGHIVPTSVTAPHCFASFERRTQGAGRACVPSEAGKKGSLTSGRTGWKKPQDMCLTKESPIFSNLHWSP